MKRNKYLLFILIVMIACFLGITACRVEEEFSTEGVVSSLTPFESTGVENSSGIDEESSFESSQESCIEESSVPSESSVEEESSIEEDSSVEEVPPCSHSWKEESRTQFCDKNGISVSTCILCGEGKTEVTPLLDHNEVIDNAIPATCEREGKTEGSHCGSCNQVIVAQQTFAKVDHDYIDNSCKWCGLAVLKFQWKTNGYYCTGTDASDVRKVIIPDEYKGAPVVGIAEKAFSFKTGLNSLTIGKNVTKIQLSAFDGCYNLVEVYDFSTTQVTSHDEYKLDLQNYVLDFYTEPCDSKIHKDANGYITYKADNGEVIFLGYKGTCPADNVLTIPEGVTVMNSYCVSPTEWVEKVVISNSVTYIRRKAFYNAPNLKELIIGESVEKIDPELFDVNNSLERVVFKDPENWLVRFTAKEEWKTFSESIDVPEEAAKMFNHTHLSEDKDFTVMYWKKSWVS